MLNYKNPASVGNRINRLKKKFEIQLTCSNAAANANNGSAATGTGRKGAKARRGPVKAKAAPTGDATEGEQVETPKKKPGRKPGPKAAPKKKDKGPAAAAGVADFVDAEAAKEDGDNGDEA